MILSGRIGRWILAKQIELAPFTLFLLCSKRKTTMNYIVIAILTLAFFFTGCTTTPSPITENVVSPEKPSVEGKKLEMAHSPEEQAIPDPSPGEFVAFSLKVAQKMIEGVRKGEDYRIVYPKVFKLAGINKIHGLVYDRENKDTIIVGKYEANRQPLTLDDFVVALKARFIHGKWPLVSIDPSSEPQNDMQQIRFEGGIEDTQFGQDLFDADYQLKQMGMGLLPIGVPAVKSYWETSTEDAKTTKRSAISSRFWFYPVLPSVLVREDVVSIKGLKVGVFTEVLSAKVDGKKIENLSTFQDSVGDKFASGISENFEALTKVHPSFARVQGLDEMVALTKAIEEMEEKPELDWWFEGYQVKNVNTKREIKVLKREGNYELPITNGIYRGYQEMSGGVELMAIALRLDAGDVTALKEAVLKTRPKVNSLKWHFIVGEWLIPTSPGMISMEDIVPLFTQAVFLDEHERYDEAIALLGQIIELKPKAANTYNERGIVFWKKGQYDLAISDYDKAIKINPKDAWAYNNRGAAFAKKGQYDRAISDFDKAIEINPKFAEPYTNQGNAFAEKGQSDRAIFNHNKAIEINPKDASAYSNRGTVFYEKGQSDRAISDFDKAIEINPKDASAYSNRGTVFYEKGQDDRAISDFDKAIKINPKFAEPYINRGNAFAKKGQDDRAISDFDKAIAINPKYVSAYNNLGTVFVKKGQYDRAISDFDKAIDINTKYASAYSNRGAVFYEKGQSDRAISDFDKAIEINPKLAKAYNNRAVFYLFYEKEYEKAWRDVRKAQSLGYQVHPEFLRRLHEASGK